MVSAPGNLNLPYCRLIFHYHPRFSPVEVTFHVLQTLIGVSLCSFFRVLLLALVIDLSLVPLLLHRDVEALHY
jgi:hypothetical protein